MYRMIALCLLVSACSTTLPPRDTFPVPNELLLRVPKPLKKLPGEGPVTPQVLMETVAENYGICRENSVAHEELINWIHKQNAVR